MTATPASSAPARPRATGSGPGRVLVAVYGVLGIAATARSAVQLSQHFQDAPLAYLLSALAATVYLVATAALARGMRRTAWLTVSVELVGVLAVGALSVALPDLFPDETVWSRFGSGYGFVPLVLPVLGLLWLRRTGAPGAASAR